MFTYRNRFGGVAHQPKVKASRDYRNTHPRSKRRDVLQIPLIAGNVQGRSSQDSYTETSAISTVLKSASLSHPFARCFNGRDNCIQPIGQGCRSGLQDKG